MDDFHRRLAHRPNVSAVALFFLLASTLYCLYAAHLVWVRMPSGRFAAGLLILAAAVLVNNFVYVVVADVLCDARQERRRIFHLLLSTLAISGVFSILGAAVYEAGVLGLWKIRYALAAGVGIVAVWQLGVEAVNLRRLHRISPLRAAVTELVSRGLAVVLALAFVALLSGASRPWNQWRNILWVFMIR